MLSLCKNQDFVFASRYLQGGGSDDDTIITKIEILSLQILGKIFSL